jgi:hypothetical protein
MTQANLAMPVQLRLREDIWLAAAALAGLRKAVNDPIRGQNRSRGAAKNVLNDIQGAIGELLALQRVSEVASIERVEHNLLSLSSPIDDVDVIIGEGEHSLPLEAKCLLMEQRKRLFLVNQIAHQRSLARKAQGYIPILTSPGSSTAFVGALIPVAEIDKWPVHQFQYGDPAYGLDLPSFTARYFDRSETKIRETLEVSRERLARFEQDLVPIVPLMKQKLPLLRQQHFTITNLGFEQVIQTLYALVTR